MATKLLITPMILLVFVFPAVAVEWQSLGLDGVVATSIETDLGLVFVTELLGLHYLDISSGLWTSHVDSAGYAMFTALTRYPPEPSRVILGGGTPIFTGYLAVSHDMGENIEFVTGINSGTVTDLATSYFSEVFHVFASTALGESAPGELLRSTDGGLNWEVMAGHLHFDLSAVVAIDTNEVWVAGDAQVTCTLDSGQTWESFRGNLNPNLPVQCFWTSPAVVGLPDTQQLSKDDPQSYAGPLFASNQEGLFLAYPDTAVWQQILPEPCRAVVGVFRQEGTFLVWYEIVAVTLAGQVLYARDFEDYQVWYDWTEGIAPAVPIDVAVWDRYYVLTQEAGVFRTDMPISDVPEAGEQLRLTAYPNPFNPSTTFAFTVAEAGWCKLAMFDVSGRRVATLRDQEVHPGPMRVTWQPQDLASGVYLARLTLGDETAVRQVVLLK